MALQEGPKANGRNPQIDILSSFDLQRPGKGDTDLDGVIDVSHQGSGMTIPEGPVAPQDPDAFDHKRRKKQSCRYVDIHTGEERIRRQMTPN